VRSTLQPRATQTSPGCPDAELRDPRRRGKVNYPLPEILLLCLLAVLAGAETITDIALFHRKNADSGAKQPVIPIHSSH
jgi:hypothetical protein